MKQLTDPALLLELGGIGALALLLAGAALLVLGRLGGDLARGRAHAEAAPAPGQVPPERQLQIGGSSPR
jgi:hypothetical protein